MLNVLYFAWVKERIGRDEERFPLPPGVQTVGDLASFLELRDAGGKAAFARPSTVRAAVNQDFATAATPIHDGDEVAFFPPVTGG